MINKTPITTGHSPESVAGIMSSRSGLSGHKNTSITTTTVTTNVDTVTIDTNTSNTTTTSESVPGVPVPGPGHVGVGHEIGSIVPRVVNAESASVTGTGTGIHNGNISVTGISSGHGAGTSGISSSTPPSEQRQQHGQELNNTAGKNLNTTSTAVEDETNSATNNSINTTPDQQQDIIPLRAKPAPHQPDHSEDHPIDHPGHHPEDPQQHPGDPSDDPQAQAEPSESNHNHYPGHCPCAHQPTEPGAQPPASLLPSTYIKSSPLTSDTPNAYGPQGGDHHQDSTIITPNCQHPPNMIFSDLYKSPRSPLNKLRHSFPHHQPPVVLPPDLDADLVSKDKAKQKEAVRKFLSEKIRNDWEFEWPPVTQSQSQSPAETTPTSNEKQEKSDIAEQPPSDNTTSPNEHGSPRIATDEAAAVETCDDAIALRDPGEVADSESDAESVYSTISEDLVHYRPRAEWTSDLSDNDEPKSAAAATSSSSPFRFDNPDAVGTAVKDSLEAKRAKRRRAVRDEASWNPGLACFEARRNAWTGAKTVRVKPKPTSPVSPTTERSSTTRRLSFWRHHKSSESTSAGAPPVGSPPPASTLTAPLSPTTTRTSQQSAQSDAISDTSAREAGTGGGNATDTTVPSTTTTTSSSSAPDNHSSYPVQTLLPLPPPLLPPQNPMRASVTPSIYPSLYDKIIINNMQPSCPVNLSDMLRACVVGWKRDGEWPPKSQYTNVAAPPMPVPKPMTAEEIAAQRQRKVAAAKQLQAQKEMRERVAKEAEEVRERAREAARQQREERERVAREQREQKEERERLEKQEKEREKAERQAEKMRRKSDATSQAGVGAREGRRSSIVALVGGVVNHLTRVPTAEDRERVGSQESDENAGGGKGGIRRSLQKVFSLGHGGHNAQHGA
ncbi:hypothetical protein B0T20DRAFT_394243 [Sordaria brevicollis]|uniref:Gag1-like clamp domain-containing protein n=1 Tax=Sordaria brevicollis TaxID=83679 RepID=A0AAE0PC41_SORBR|nr:hypothetical protein B0T20DRAFT_394243 [Sordaria brevicollis]